MMMASKEMIKSTWVLTITKQGMCKRTIVNTGDMIPRLDENGEKIWDDAKGDWATKREGYRVTRRGAKGPKAMGLNEGDSIVRVHQIPSENDQLMLLSAKGTVIRIAAGQTKANVGMVTKGTRVMDLRDKKDKTKFVDELIFSARLPAELVDESDAVDEITQENDGGEEE
jgi:DNA gyrase subunit A